MGLGYDPETIKERVTLPCQVYVSDFMVQRYPKITQDLLAKECKLTYKDKESPLHFTGMGDLEAVKILLYT